MFLKPTPKAAAALGAILGALLCVFVTAPLERTLFDIWQRMAPRQIAADNVVVVLIDDHSLAAVSAWPWPRYYMASLTASIATQHPAGIGFDMIFPESDPLSSKRFSALYPDIDDATSAKLGRLPSMDETFGAVIGEARTVLPRLAVHSNGSAPDSLFLNSPIFGSPPPNTPAYNQVLASIAELEGPASGLAILNGSPDSDAIVRRVPLTAIVANSPTPGLAVEMVRIAMGVERLEWRGSKMLLGDEELPADDAGNLAFRFGSFPDAAVFSAADVLANRIPSNAFTGKIVLVGLGAQGTADIVATPLMSEQFGILVQAQAIDAILNRGWLTRPPWIVALEWLVGGLLALLVLGSTKGHRKVPLVIAGAIGGGLPPASFFAFDRANLLFNPITPLLIGLGAFIASEVVRYAEQEQARLRIHRAFDKYLSPELVERIARDPSHLELGGEERDMTVMFCDVRGFSAMSEKMSPQEIIRFLIGLLTPMTDILLAGRATIDKYVGDAIIAFWNAPVDDELHATNAADAALAMTARLRELNVEMPNQEKYPWPGDVRIGIGLNSGLVCVGNMGSERRLNYSMIGDTVNLASRIEGLTKFYGVDIAVGKNLADRLKDYALIQLDLVKVVGREQPEEIFALFGNGDAKKSASFAQLAADWAEFTRQYRSRQWHDALVSLKGLDADGEWQVTKLRLIYQDRIAHLQAEPPGTEWNGVYVATEK